MMKSIVKLFVIAAVLVAVLAMAMGFFMQASAETVGLANPMKEVSREELLQVVGVDMAAPEGAENVRCFTITAGDVVIGQVDFTLDGKEYTYRATTAELDPTELSGVFFTEAVPSGAKISYCEARIFTQELTSVLFWEDKVPGVCYSIACTDCWSPVPLMRIAEEIFVPMQSDGVGGEENATEYPDLEGLWQDANGNTVELTAVGGNLFDANVSIVRLSQFPGFGNLDAISMDLTLEDPNGSILYAEFYSNEDGTCTLVVSDSIWSLLENNTVFTGFTRVEK